MRDKLEFALEMFVIIGFALGAAIGAAVLAYELVSSLLPTSDVHMRLAFVAIIMIIGCAAAARFRGLLK